MVTTTIRHWRPLAVLLALGCTSSLALDQPRPRIIPDAATLTGLGVVRLGALAPLPGFHHISPGSQRVISFLTPWPIYFAVFPDDSMSYAMIVSDEAHRIRCLYVTQYQPFDTVLDSLRNRLHSSPQYIDSTYWWRAVWWDEAEVLEVTGRPPAVPTQWTLRPLRPHERPYDPLRPPVTWRESGTCAA